MTDDFEAWNSEVEVMCETNHCTNEATQVTKTHKAGPFHSVSFRCETCVQYINTYNQRTLKYSGALACIACGGVFRTLEAWMHVEPIEGIKP